MSSRTITTLSICAAIGSGIVGGVLFAFSAFVMKALDKLPPQQSIRTMQAINKAAVTPLFMLVLLGTAILCAVLAWSSLARPSGPATRYLLIGGAAAYLGAVLITIIYHVPHNNALAAANPLRADAARRWHDYTTGWTAWNHVRALLAITGAVLFTIAHKSADGPSPRAAHSETITTERSPASPPARTGPLETAWTARQAELPPVRPGPARPIAARAEIRLAARAAAGRSGEAPRWLAPTGLANSRQRVQSVTVTAHENG